MLEFVLEVTMSKVILAEYDAEGHALKLSEPLAGLKDHEKVRISIEDTQEPTAERPWLAFRGSLDEESGRQIAAAIQEAFGRDEIEI